MEPTHTTTRYVRNPLIGYLFSLAWLLIAIIFFIPFINYASVGLGTVFDVPGVRVPGVILFTPFMALIIAIFYVVNATRAVRPRKQYIATRNAAQQKSDYAAQFKNVGSLLALLITAASLLGAGIIALLLVLFVNDSNTIGDTSTGTALFTGVILLLLLGLVSSVGLAIKIKAATK